MELASTDWKDVGRNVLAVGLLLPIVWHLLKANREDTKRFFEEMSSKHDNLEKLVKQESIKTRLAFGNTVLNKEQTVMLMKEKMWYVSTQKIQFIQTVLINNHISGREEQVKQKISSELIRLSGQYIGEMSSFITPV